MKVHTGTDTENALVHTLEVATAKVYDSRMFWHLIRTYEEEVAGARPMKQRYSELLEMCGAENRVIKKKPKGGQLTREQENANKANTSFRAVAEHLYRTVSERFK